MKMIRTGVVALVASLGVAFAAPAAMASPHQAQSGLVNVAIGDIQLLNHVNVGIAALVAANVCGVSVGPVAVLANEVRQTNTTETVCTIQNLPVTLRQAA